MDARTYGIAAERDCQQWVDWMLDVTAAAVRVSKGLVLWVVSGVQRDNCYWPGCEGLMWEWWKRGNQLWCPCVWWKVDENDGGTGIPGSGGNVPGKRWLRKDWEYVLCFKKEGNIPYDHPEEMGHEPIYGRIGGAMSNRTQDGRRINAGVGSRLADARTKEWAEDPWKTASRGGSGVGGRTKDGEKKAGPTRRKNGKYKHVARDDGPVMDGIAHDSDGNIVYAGKRPFPKIANPGNVLTISQPDLSLAELVDILIHYEQTTNSTPHQVLRDMRQADSAFRLREWFHGVCLQIRAAALLRSSLLGSITKEATTGEDLSVLRSEVRTNDKSKRATGEFDGIQQEDLLQSPVSMQSDCEAGRPEAWGIAASGSQDSAKNDGAGCVREVRPNESPECASQGRRCDEQRSVESSSLVYVVPSEGTQERGLLSSRVYQSVPWIGILQQALPAFQKVWRSLGESLWPWETKDGGGLIVKARVGGGHIGNRIAHSNEAPYPEKLCEFFIRSFCPPGGVCLDPFSGSGTTAAVAVRWKRRALGFDIRQSQIELAKRRIQGETPCFPEMA